MLWSYFVRDTRAFRMASAIHVLLSGAAKTLFSISAKSTVTAILATGLRSRRGMP